MTVLTYDRPREKIAKQGVGALSDGELLQVLIGSGSAKVSAARIAKKVLKTIQRSGSKVSYEDLERIKGLGPARISVLLAGFELASRYPVDARQVSLDSIDAIVTFVAQQGGGGKGKVGLITLDGAQRMLGYHHSPFVGKANALVVKDIVSQALSDKAAGLIVVQPSETLLPSMGQLMVARDLKRIAQTFGLAKVDYLLINGDKHYSIMKDVGT